MILTHSLRIFHYFEASLRDLLLLEHSDPSSQAWPVLVKAVSDDYDQFIASVRLRMTPDLNRGDFALRDQQPLTAFWAGIRAGSLIAVIVVSGVGVDSSRRILFKYN